VGAFQRDEILRTIFSSMGQIVFFTVGEDECRAWPMPKRADAVVGAGQIHTDLAKTFVRAEGVSYADFERCGSMKEAKQQGVETLEGNTTVENDGDVVYIRSSVCASGSPPPRRLAAVISRGPFPSPGLSHGGRPGGGSGDARGPAAGLDLPAGHAAAAAGP